MTSKSRLFTKATPALETAAGSLHTNVMRNGSTVLMGGLIEIAQYFVPGRSSEWGDLLADAGGAVTGAALALLWLRLVVAPLQRQADAKMAQPAAGR